MVTRFKYTFLFLPNIHFLLKKYIFLFKLIKYIAKNEKDILNKLIWSKLIAYNKKMSTNNIIKASDWITYVSRSATLTSKSLIEFVIDWNWSFNRTNRAQLKNGKSNNVTSRRRKSQEKLIYMWKWPSLTKFELIILRLQS